MPHILLILLRIPLLELSVVGYSLFGCAARFVCRQSVGLFPTLAELSPSQRQVIQLAAGLIINIYQFVTHININVAWIDVPSLA